MADGVLLYVLTRVDGSVIAWSALCAACMNALERAWRQPYTGELALQCQGCGRESVHRSMWSPEGTA